MDACGCGDFASIFDRRTAQADRDRYREKGPDRTTAILLDMVRPALDVLDRTTQITLPDNTSGTTSYGFSADRAGATPLLSFFVDAVSRSDESLLDELERLIREKRREEGR